MKLKKKIRLYTKLLVRMAEAIDTICLELTHPHMSAGELLRQSARLESTLFEIEREESNSRRDK
jgi:hypothetical protein